MSAINPLTVSSPFSERDVTLSEVLQVRSGSWTRRSVLSPLPGASAWKSRLHPVPPHPTFKEKWGGMVGPEAPESDCLETPKSEYKASEKVPDLRQH